MTPQEHLASIGRQYPRAWDMMRELIRDRGKPPLPDWPDWCLLPMAGWYSIITAHTRTETVPLVSLADIARLSALGAWRLTQGVYRFEPELLSALTQTPLEGDIPADALLRLPEWCVYVDMGGDSGFFAFAECDVKNYRRELRIVFNAGCRLLTDGVLHIGDWPLREALARADSEAARLAEQSGLPTHIATDEQLAARESVMRLPINLLLYLCSEEPELSPQRGPDRRPQRRIPARDKRGGWQIPDGVTVWDVGQEIGARLREGSRGWTVEGRASPRPHIRRAHWHGFWRGVEDERKFFHKWLPPLFVGGE